MKQLYTRWGKKLDAEHVHQEYPRPLLQRDSYINLNGYWEYAITEKFRKPERYDGQILVPFSPESALSGVGRQLMPDEYLWYRTKFSVDMDRLKAGCKLILHFGAVDQACRIYINGKEAAHHTGGYLPFSTDITKYCLTALAAPARCELVLAVRDLSDTSYHAKGKQKLKRGGMFYTAQSGIWQTVWMEYLPADYIEVITAEPDLEQGFVKILIHSSSDLPVTVQIKEPALYHNIKPYTECAVADCQESSAMHPYSPQNRLINSQESASRVITEVTGQSNHELKISLPIIQPWSCDEPYLYYFTVIMGEDSADSYFALRDIKIEPDQNGIPRILLNGEVQFQNGVLDQGYWPDGLYTAPSDEAHIFDIMEMKKMGFNMIRKHIKIEPQRWYYHCDRLGMIVWQDMVNGGSCYKHWFVTYAATLLSRSHWKIPDTCLPLLSRTHEKGRREFVREMKETIRLLKGHPSIAVWVIFNEGWGQFHVRKITQIAEKCDNSRLIDQASGWFDQNGGHMQSIHHYFFKMKFTPEKKRATVLSEFGGYSLRIPEHSACDKLYGYGVFKDTDSLRQAYNNRMLKVKEQIPDGLCASVYTQLSDVEEEVNGILTYDREINKLL